MGRGNRYTKPRPPAAPAAEAKATAAAPLIGRRPTVGLLARVAVVLAVAVLTRWLWSNRLLPALGTDSLIYHLPLPAAWCQRGFLAAVDLPFHDAAAEHAPMLSETICYGLMRLTGDDGLTWLIQPVFFLATLRLFHLSARLLGAGRDLGLILTALLAGFRPFLASVQVVNNELILTAGAAAMLYGLLRARLGGGRAILWVAGGAALMLATKTIGIVYAAVGLGLALPAAWRRWRGSPIRRRIVGPIVAAAILAAGASFYVRNWALHGNPVFPAEVRLFGATVFPGLYDAGVLIDHGWSAAALGAMLVHDTATFAMPLTAGVLLWCGWGVSAARSVAWRRRGGWPAPAAGCLFPLVAALLFFAVTPFWREHRLLFPVYYGLWVASAGGVAWLSRLVGRRVGLAIKALGLAAVLAPLALLIAVGEVWLLVAGALAATVAAFRLRRPIPARVRWAAVAVATAVAIAWAAAGYDGYRAARREMRGLGYERFYGPEGRAWNAIDRLGGDAAGGLTVAYAGTPVIYPLYGADLANRVVYVPVSPADAPTRIDLECGQSLYRRLAEARRAGFDEVYWLAGLRRRDVDLLYLVDRADTGGAAPELAAAARHEEIFERLLAEGEVTVFRLLRP